MKCANTHAPPASSLTAYLDRHRNCKGKESPMYRGTVFLLLYKSRHHSHIAQDPFETEYNVARCVTRDGLYTVGVRYDARATRPDTAHRSGASSCEHHEFSPLGQIVQSSRSLNCARSAETRSSCTHRHRARASSRHGCPRSRRRRHITYTAARCAPVAHDYRSACRLRRHT